MIMLDAYRGRTVAVFGLGKAGEATVDALRASGATVLAWDDNPDSCSKLSARVGEGVLKPFDAWPWPELAALVLGPGVPLTHPAPHAAVVAAHKAGCPIIGDVELLCDAQREARKIAITGTNGKSTTTTLIHHLLSTAGVKAEVGGNLGTAALSLQPLGAGGTYVLECSSYQLDLTHRARFDIAVFLNITPDHLDRHGDMEGYVRAKLKIFANQRPGDAAVVAVDDDHTRRIADELEARKQQRVVRVSAQCALPHGVYVQDGILHDAMEGVDAFRLDLRGIVTLTGQHNWQNAAVAYATARLCGLAPETIATAMRSFAGLAHRLELVAEINQVRFINDSKATNADATSHALAPYDQVYWIAGGKAKAGGIEPLAPLFGRVAHAFLIGAAEEEFARTLEGKIPYTRCGTLENATRLAAAMAFAQKRKGAAVLLSPACASFDQWSNFEERGDAFRRYVQALGREMKHAV